jgi:DNA (cytosine-5)-methyltransferase 1
VAAFYNEIDPYAAAWLRNLIDAGHIAPGVVDERDIRDIRPEELHPYDQCHFFAGIGVWSHALRRAGWEDDRPIWTGSCPCQPFSAAGKQAGFDDERHLWPVWQRLIAQRRPAIVVGEQVASALDWLDLVSADMEAEGYAFGASDLCAAGIGAPHIRQRLWFVGVADTDDERSQGWDRVSERAGQFVAGPGSVDGRVADAKRDQCRQVGAIAGGRGSGSGTQGLDERSGGSGLVGERLADADGGDASAERQQPGGQHGQQQADDSALPAHGAHAPMLGRNAADWLFCRDGKWRPVEPGTFPLAHGATARVGRLRAYGNAIVAPLAQAFVETVMECL